MPFDVLRTAALARGAQTLAQLGDELLHAVTIALKGRVGGIDVRVEDYHPQQSVLNPQAGQRQTACMRYISAPQRSHSVWASVRGVAAGAVLSAEAGLTGVRGRLCACGASILTVASCDRKGAEAGGVGSDIAGIIAHD